MPEATVRIAAVLLATLFAWAALAKVVRHRAWSQALRGYKLPGAIEAAARSSVPVVEAAVALLLLVGETHTGAALCLVLVAGFSLVVFRTRRFVGDSLPCGCFGGSKETDYRTMLVRNGLLGGLAAVLLLSPRDVRPLDGLGIPSTGEALPAVLIAAGVALGAWIVHEVSVSARRGGRP